MHTGKRLLSVNQVCYFGHHVDDCPKHYVGTQAITTTQGCVLPLSYCRALCRIAIRKPTKKELASYVPEELTNPMEWNPTLEYDSDTPLEHHLASANTLLPVPTGEGVQFLKLLIKKITIPIQSTPSHQARHADSVAKKQCKHSKMFKRNHLTWTMFKNVLVGSPYHCVKRHWKPPHSMLKIIFVYHCRITTKPNSQHSIVSI